ncbi:unnamed protein product [Echinostoma caproni]|uniref:Pericentrin n=1 Tax=Echinostoma caproni TaxID=27848 RepID=A0A183B557_9TREM|nr:unnamed protein product [Echinostoma caproni]
MVCTEVETLRSKLRDVEAQLAQQLLERETAEKDARRQQELYSQLKLQQTVQEKRRAHNARHSSTNMDPKHLGSQMRLNALHSGDEIECEDPALARVGSKDSVASVSSKTKSDAIPLRDGENLGSVLESELRASHLESSRLKDQLEEMSVQLHKREEEVAQLTERLRQLTDDLASTATQSELSDQAADQARTALTQWQTELATLVGRLIWARTINRKSLDEFSHKSNTDAHVRLEIAEILDRVKGIGSGLPDTLNEVCQLFTANLDDVWTLITEQLSSFQSQVTDLRSAADRAKTELFQKEEELVKLSTQIQEQSKHHALQLAAEQNAVAELQKHLLTLRQEHSIESQLVVDLERQVETLTREKQQLTANLDQVQIEVATQTDKSIGELPIHVDVSPLSDSLCRSDLDEDGHCEVEDDQPVTEEQAYKALAADRRGLSDELVRLHDELAESHVDRSALRNQHTPTSGPLEEWLESVTVNNASKHRRRPYGRKPGTCDATELSDSLSGLSSHAYELGENEEPPLSVTDS